eukprot:1136723-Pelagomonas_calceolata.AAC.2
MCMCHSVRSKSQVVLRAKGQLAGAITAYSRRTIAAPEEQPLQSSNIRTTKGVQQQESNHRACIQNGF